MLIRTCLGPVGFMLNPSCYVPVGRCHSLRTFGPSLINIYSQPPFKKRMTRTYGPKDHAAARGPSVKKDTRTRVDLRSLIDTYM